MKLARVTVGDVIDILELPLEDVSGLCEGRVSLLANNQAVMLHLLVHIVGELHELGVPTGNQHSVLHFEGVLVLPQKLGDS